MSFTETTQASRATVGCLLDAMKARMARLCAEPGLRNYALGVPDWDRELCDFGRTWIKAHHESIPKNSVADGPDVYLATQIDAQGGATPVIGDFVRALASDVDPLPHLILTDVDGSQTMPLEERTIARTGIGAERITILKGASLFEKMEHLFRTVLALHPRRLFLLQFPDDPLPGAVAQPEIAPSCFLVHCMDAMPTFGLHAPDLRVIDLNPSAAAMSRLGGLEPALLPLTSPDPGPRPQGFLRRGKLMTASSGRPEKFSTPYFLTYAEFVAVVLKHTEGWHTHFGALDEEALSQIRAALDDAGIARDRFIHEPWVPSIARALLDQGCDAYLSSFPIDGARTNAEVFAAGLPYVGHSRLPLTSSCDPAPIVEGGLLWHTWSDLTQALDVLSHKAELEQRSVLARAHYERLHHPAAFARTLVEILAGGLGFNDSRAHERDHRATSRLLRTLTNRFIARLEDTKKQEKRIDFLQDQRRQLVERVRALEEENRRQMKGGSLRARIRRWLLKP